MIYTPNTNINWEKFAYRLFAVLRRRCLESLSRGKSVISDNSRYVI